MKQISRLTAASEQRISNALSKVAELLEEGETPNSAIIKIATQEKIPHDHVDMMCRAFNTGQSLSHLHNNHTLEEKAAAFKLADTWSVLEGMYPDHHKTAAEVHSATAVSDDYSKSPDGWLTRRGRGQMMQKAASADDPFAPMVKAAAFDFKVKQKKCPHCGMNPGEDHDENCESGQYKSQLGIKVAAPYPTLPSKRAFSEINEFRKKAETSRLDANGCAYAVVQTMDKVAEYFRNTTAEPLPIVTDNAAAVYGRRVRKLMEKVSTDKTVAKIHQHTGHYKNAPCAIDWTREPYNLIKAALDAVDHFDASQANLKDAEVAHSEKRAEVLSPFTGGLPTKPIFGSVWTAGIEKQAVIGQFARDTGAMALANTIAEFANKRMGTESDKNEMLQKSMNDLAEPKHEDKLRAIRQQAMMHEMMAGDPVISGYGYNEVMDAHNHLAEVAPKAMQNRVMAQTMLRKYLEQGQNMDMFDTQQMLDANKGLNERDMPEAMKGYLTGGMRSMGQPMPNRSQALPPETEAKTLGNTVFGANPLPEYGQTVANDVSKTTAGWLTKSPAKPAPDKDKDKDKDKRNA